MSIDPAVLANADQILAAGEPDHDALVAVVRDLLREEDRTSAVLTVCSWLNTPQWARDSLVSHLAVALIRCAEAPDAAP